MLGFLAGQGPLFNMVNEGDSITLGANLDPQTQRYANNIKINPPGIGSQSIPATSGATLVTLNGRIPTIDSTKKNVITVLIGANDLQSLSAASFVADLKTYCQTLQGMGWKVVLLTVTPAGPPFRTLAFNSIRDDANTLIRADPSFYDALADVAANPTIGVDSAYMNTSLYPDGLHAGGPTHTIIATIVSDAIAAIVW